MSVWAVQVTDCGIYPVQPDVRERSIVIYCVGIDRQPLFFFGIIPTSLLARRGFIWVHFIEYPGKAQLRLLRKVWPAYYAKLNWNLVAFCPSALTVSRRFIEFFGFRQQQADINYTLYSGDI